MLWFVNAYFAATWKGESGEFSPTLFAHVRNLHILGLEIIQGCRDVIAHKEELVLVILLGSMERRFEWRHGENQPAVTGINGREFQNIAKEVSVSFRILGVDNDMCAVNQT